MAGTAFAAAGFLKSMFAKHIVEDEELKKLLIDKFGRMQMKLDKLMQKELAAAYKYLEDGLLMEDKDVKEADRLFVEAQNNSVVALGVVDNGSQKIKAVQVGVTAIIRRCCIKTITKKTAKALVESRLNDINNMNDVKDIIKAQIKNSKTTVKSQIAAKVVQETACKLSHTSHTSHNHTGGALHGGLDLNYALMMEICRIYLTAITFFDDPKTLHDSINITIPSKKGNDPYNISIGYILMDVADHILVTPAPHKGDWLYQNRELMYMFSMVEFVVNKLDIEDGSKWRDNREFATNKEILDEIRLYRFVQCSVVKDGEGTAILPPHKMITNVVMGEEVEFVKAKRPGKMAIVRKKKENVGFDVPEDCLNLKAAEATFRSRNKHSSCCLQ